MYTLAVRRDFIARHFLIGGDWGPENEPNSHHFLVELRLWGKALNQHGYLCDIVDVEAHLDAEIDYFSEEMLNDLAEFDGLNPSIEHFARILAEKLNRRIQEENIIILEVVLWEDDSAWAAFRLDR